ncbi:MAG: metalloprotease [Halobacteria archaeon]|nr:metalloprotease [Halobacteria archaeon]
MGVLPTSRTEAQHLVVAWLALALAVALLFANPFRRGGVSLVSFGAVFVVSLVTAGSGFLLHEIAHKVVAQRYGYWAEFRADYEMLAIAVLGAAAVGFLFAAPGAVRIRSQRGRGISERHSGLISVAGPVTNIVLFVVFFGVSLFFGGIVGYIGEFGAFINAFLAAFNMVPYGPLDGAKVLRWSRQAFAVVFGLGVALVLYEFGVVDTLVGTL